MSARFLPREMVAPPALDPAAPGGVRMWNVAHSSRLAPRTSCSGRDA